MLLCNGLIDYRDDQYLIPKNTSVSVRRVPAARAKSITLRIAETYVNQHIVALSLSLCYVDMMNSDGDGGEADDSASMPPPAAPAAATGRGTDFGSMYGGATAAGDDDEDQKMMALQIQAQASIRGSQHGRGGGAHGAGGRGGGMGGMGGGGGRGGPWNANGANGGRILQGGKPPDGYTCHRCNQGGHYIQ